MSSGRVIVRACWGGTCAMDGWNRRGRCLVAPRIDVDRGAKRRGGPPPVVGGPPPVRGGGRYGAITVGSHTRVRH